MLRKWFINRRRARARVRGLFMFWNGSAWRSLDANVILRKMRQHPEYVPSKHLPILNKDDGFGEMARRVTLDAMQVAFEIKPYDDRSGEGMTEIEMWELFNVWTDFLVDVKKNSSEQPISPTPLDGSPSTDSLEKQFSGSNSISAESSIAEPALS